MISELHDVQVAMKLRKKTYGCGDIGHLSDIVDQVLGEMAELFDKLQALQEQIGKPFQHTSLHNLFSVVCCMPAVLYNSEYRFAEVLSSGSGLASGSFHSQHLPQQDSQHQLQRAPFMRASTAAGYINSHVHLAQQAV